MRYQKPKKRNIKKRSQLLLNLLIGAVFIGLSYGVWRLSKAAYRLWQLQSHHVAQIHIHPPRAPNTLSSSHQSSSSYWIYSQCLPSGISSKSLDQAWQSQTQDSTTNQLHIHQEKLCTQLQFGPYAYLSQTRQSELFLEQHGLSSSIHTKR